MILLEIDYDSWDQHIQQEFRNIQQDISSGTINNSIALDRFKILLNQLQTDIKLSDLDLYDKAKFTTLTVLIKIIIKHFEN